MKVPAGSGGDFFAHMKKGRMRVTIHGPWSVYREMGQKESQV